MSFLERGSCGWFRTMILLISASWVAKITGMSNQCTKHAFLNRTVIAQKIRARMDKWDCIKLKGFCIFMESVTRIKSQPTEWVTFWQLFII
jgi:hypothetical protein